MGMQSTHWTAQGSIPRKTEETALLAALIAGGCTMRLRRRLPKYIGHLTGVPTPASLNVHEEILEACIAFPLPPTLPA